MTNFQKYLGKNVFDVIDTMSSEANVAGLIVSILSPGIANIDVGDNRIDVRIDESNKIVHVGRG